MRSFCIFFKKNGEGSDLEWGGPCTWSSTFRARLNQIPLRAFYINAARSLHRRLGCCHHCCYLISQQIHSHCSPATPRNAQLRISELQVPNHPFSSANVRKRLGSSHSENSNPYFYLILFIPATP